MGNARYFGIFGFCGAGVSSFLGQKDFTEISESTVNEGNLRPFKPGQSGNPTGRRPGLSLTRLVRDELQKPAEPGATTTRAEVVAEKVVGLAMEGHTIFTPLVWRYVDGEPKDARERTLGEIVDELAEKMGIDPAVLRSAFERELKSA